MRPSLEDPVLESGEQCNQTTSFMNACTNAQRDHEWTGLQCRASWVLIRGVVLELEVLGGDGSPHRGSVDGRHTPTVWELYAQ